jgi:ElaB/YqjD/DUF883 family membrane-anchored ribosome-binding protein
MNHHRQTHPIRDNVDQLAEDARALMTATADVAGEKVEQARERLAAALEQGKEAASDVRKKAIECAKAADKTVRSHPYQAIGIAVGVGALVGYLAARKWSSRD